LSICKEGVNVPAVNLYLKNGYKKIKDIEVNKNVILTEFEKVILVVRYRYGC